MNITIREVNPRFWKELKIQAVTEGVTLGQAVNLALERWLSEKAQPKKKKTKSFWNIKPIDMPGTEHDSLRVDEVLYGGKM
ncbi:MAG TPA: hypothetical protein VJG90_00335 [Candidatus Nanoarchaeia archaeon]|nr:hypothetical protein [Candidatus Nanoarchaeia archaeon]